MSVDVKICGLRDAAGVDAAVNAGARYVGFVFYPSSKRYILPVEAGELTALVPSSVKRVGLFVDATDAEIRDTLTVVPLNILQLHGNETPARVEAVRRLSNLPVMKALRIANAEDLKVLADFDSIADRLMFDARVGDEPGGTGQSFDWNLLAGHSFRKPWMLAGGLNASNLAEAVRITGARTVDVSSGVESSPGQKESEKIREFIGIAAKLDT